MGRNLNLRSNQGQLCKEGSEIYCFQRLNISKTKINKTFEKQAEYKKLYYQTI